MKAFVVAALLAFTGCGVRTSTGPPEPVPIVLRCDPAELRAAKVAHDAPLTTMTRVSEIETAWLRWYRAAEACGVDWPGERK